MPPSVQLLPQPSPEDFASSLLLSYAAYQWPGYNAARHHRLIASKLEAVERGEIKRLMIFMPPRHGKQLDHETPIFTANKGWGKHGDLVPGDMVYGPAGLPIEVIAVGPESVQDCEVEFFDGSIIKCHENHEWTVYDRAYGRWATVSTKYLLGRAVTNAGRATLQLPEIAALQAPDAELPVEPYFFGAWLGDGKSSGSTLCGAEADLDCILERVEYASGARWIHKGTGVHYQYVVDGALDALRLAGVINNKHIPPIYFRASERQRRLLLAGIVDTDGSLDETTGRIRFRSGMKRLADDVAELVRSLGYRASVDYTAPDTRDRQIKGGASWCVQWTPHDKLGGGFLPRKIAFRQRDRRRVGIKAVRRCAPSMGRCIQVDAHDGLYLAGRHLTPTHNSMLASEFFPAWYLGRNPSNYVIAATYAQDLADDFGRKVRNQIKDETFAGIFPGISLREDSSAVRRFHIAQPIDALQTSQAGAYFAVGIGGPLTGRGAHLLLIDDPVKNREEAESKVVRDRTQNWYTSTAYTRLMPGGAIIVIQTRWHESDLGGWLLEEHKHENWEVLELPAIDKNGKALWPEQYDVKALNDIRQAIGPRDWSALYDQKPTPETGDFFKAEWLKPYTKGKAPDRKTLDIYGGSDYATTQNGGDFTAHVVFGIDPDGNAWLLDIWRKQTSSDKWVEAWCDLVIEWKPLGWGEENGQIKSGVGPFLDREARARKAYCAREQFPTRGSKATRAQSFRGYAAQYGIYVPIDHPEWPECRRELLTFPAGAHDDFVDSCALVFQLLDRMTNGRPLPADEPDSDLHSGYQSREDEWEDRDGGFDKAI